MKFLKIIIVALLFVLALILIIQNQEVFTHQHQLKLDLKAYEVGPYITSNLVIVVGSFLAGVIFAIMLGVFYAVSMRGELKEKERKIKELQQQKRGESPVPLFNTPSSEKEGTRPFP